MALLLNKKTPQNAVASYWKISALMVRDRERVAEIVVEGYVDEETRRAVDENGAAKFQPLTEGVQRIERAEFTAAFGASPDYPSKATLYEFLKASPEWAGAVEA